MSRFSLSQKNEMRLAAGSWTSRLGNIVFDYANSVTIVHGFGASALVLALYQSSETLISVIFNLLGGVAADGSKKKRILVVTDLLSGLVCLVLSFFLHSRLLAMAMILANVLLAVIGAFNSPTYKSVVREVVEVNRISRFNSISHGGSELIKIGGPVAGLLLVDIIGVRGALLINAATFLISALLEAGLISLVQEAATERRRKNILREISEGLRYIVSEREIFFLLILSSLCNFFLAGYNLLIPYTDVMYEGVYTGFYAKILMAEAAGGIAGSLVSARIAKGKPDSRMLISCLLADGICLAFVPAAGAKGILVIAVLPFFLFGLLLTLFNIQYLSYVQVCANPEFLGRVFSVVYTLAILFMPLGSFFFSAISHTADVRSFYPVSVGLIALGIVFLMLIGRTQKA